MSYQCGSCGRVADEYGALKTVPACECGHQCWISSPTEIFFGNCLDARVGRNITYRFYKPGESVHLRLRAIEASPQPSHLRVIQGGLA